MKLSLRRLLTVALFATLLSMPLGTGAGAASRPWFIATGDSWSGWTATTMGAVSQRFLPINLDSITGSSARTWASNDARGLGLLNFVVRVAPANPVVYLSLGAHDLRDGRSGDQIRADLTSVVDRILAMRGDVRVVMAGYDILNFEKSPLCRAWVQSATGTVEPEPSNRALYSIGQIQEEIAAGRDRVTYLNLWGMSQGQTGNPDFTRWAPRSNLSSWITDCDHVSIEMFAQRSRAIAGAV
ncbi:MAG: SGNH/GDSL hydrolase family protein [Acidimicrobiia bacterium]|nr:SGNH/GDSL hydrolase family protein [Acidimicrobiia bacterium]MBP8180610.1 SGNH/GDSL hydrolase family protein [Acidimicrobiia bacterium]